jgi:nitrile hydratase
MTTEAAQASATRFKPGDRVRVKFEERPGHIRTPYYVRGKSGWIERAHVPKKTLYLVGFRQGDVWEKYDGAAQDVLYVDIYEHWLEQA